MIKTDQQKLYDTLKNGKVTITIPFNPLLLSALGQFNCLKKEDKPDLKEVNQLKDCLSHYFNIKL